MMKLKSSLWYNPGMTIKILSWNIWINGNFEQIAEFLKKEYADIIGLQEVKDDDLERPVIEFLRDLGYEFLFTPVEKIWKSDNKAYFDGPAIFSKYKIKNHESFNLSKEESRAVIRADIEVQGKILHVFNTHLMHTHQTDSKIQNEQAENLLKLLPKEKTILMGDFNATPENSSIKKIQEVLVDSDPSATPTWSMYPAGCNVCNPQKVDVKLDYIFTSKDLKVESFRVRESQASDHLPISAIIEI